jgi:hypothetical protein
VKSLSRHLFNAATLLSLLLFAATVALWVRSYFVFDGVHHASQGSGVYADGLVYGAFEDAGSFQGRLWVAVSRTPSPSTQQSQAFPRWSLDHHYYDPKFFTPVSWFERKGLFHEGWSGYDCYGTPHALLAAISAFLPVGRILLALRFSKVSKTGHCFTCGYDLRATPDRCPECGNVPGKVKA